jgi:Uncharacterized conserved protein (DUF2358)
MNIVEILKEDYQRFPIEQTFSIYASNVYFKDPLNQFRGIKRYQEMIGFLSKFFKDIHMELHEIKQTEDAIDTEWTLSMTAPLPWKPRLAIPGRSELKLDRNQLITSHIDYWHISRFDVLKQVLIVKI